MWRWGWVEDGGGEVYCRFEVEGFLCLIEGGRSGRHGMGGMAWFRLEGKAWYIPPVRQSHIVRCLIV